MAAHTSRLGIAAHRGARRPCGAWIARTPETETYAGHNDSWAHHRRRPRQAASVDHDRRPRAPRRWRALSGIANLNRLVVELVDGDGHAVGDPGGNPIAPAPEFEVGRPPGHPIGAPLVFSQALMFGLELGPSRYVWRAVADGTEAASVSFNVIPPPGFQRMAS
jgi:hypothetical protein